MANNKVIQVNKLWVLLLALVLFFLKTDTVEAAVALRGIGGANSTTNTTSMTMTIPAATQSGDDMYVLVVSRDHASGTAKYTCTDDEGAGSWAEESISSDRKTTLFWKKATVNSASKTITISGAVGSVSGGLSVMYGGASGDPTTDIVMEENISGNEAHATFTPTNDGSFVMFGVTNDTNDLDITNLAAATLGTLEPEQWAYESTGGSDCKATLTGKAQAGVKAATGAFSWSQTNGTTDSISFAIKPAVDITGTVYTNEAKSTNIGANKTVALYVNSTSKSTAETAAGGTYSFSGLTGISANDSITIYLDGESENGSTTTLAVANISIASLDIITDRVIVQSETASAITNTDLDDVDGIDAENEDGLTISAGALTVADTYELFIPAGEVFAPGGNVSTQKLHIKGTYTGASETLTLTGSGTGACDASQSTTLPLCVDAGSTFTPTSNTAIFTGTASSSIDDTTYYNVSFTPTIAGAVTYTFLGAETINGNFTVNPTSAGSNALTVNLGGTTTVAATKTTTISGTTLGTSNLDTASGSSFALSTGFLSIEGAGTLTARNSTITLTGTSGTIFTRTGTFDVSLGTSTVNFSQTTGSTTLTSGTFTFDNLQVNMSGRVGTLGQNITVNDTLTVTAGTLDTSSSNRQVDVKDVSIGGSGTFYGRASTINVTGNWSNSGAYTYATSTVNLSGSGAQQVSGATTFFILAATASTARAVTFVNSSVTSIAASGTLTLTGTSVSSLLTLQSDSGGADWYLQVSLTGTTVNVSYVSVSDSNASGYTQIDASDGTSVDDGGNTYWLFPYVAPIPITTNFTAVNMTGINVNYVTCGDTFAIRHTTAGGVAPVNKTVTYGTVATSIGGTGSKCWITQNLGATDQASSATDSDEDSAGWYWQFNRKQGYKHDGSTLTPSWTITSIDEDSDWAAANDPCTLELGAGWRLPTLTEWDNVDGAPQSWASYTDAYNSVLKLHAAGELLDYSGGVDSRGAKGNYVSSTQAETDFTYAWFLMFDSGSSAPNWHGKAYGGSARCVKDLDNFYCGETLTKVHTTSGSVAPVEKVVHYGTVTSSIAGTGAKCWITRNLGATDQASSATDSDEASAGWYWQFNRKQGYKYDASRVPNTAWITAIDEDLNWAAANDPCTLLLGTGWRLPTNAEWTSADGAPQNWASYTDTYNSVLKIHAAGVLATATGNVGYRGSDGLYWSSTQLNTAWAYELRAVSGTSAVSDINKAQGCPLRCLKD